VLELKEAPVSVKLPKPLPKAEHPVVQNIQTIANLEQDALDKRTPLDRVTAAVARMAGSTMFIAAHAFWFTAWIVLNTTRYAFDAYPFSLLNLIVALEAVFLTSVVLLTQNQMARLTDRRAHLHMQVNMLAEQELTAMLHMLHGLCAHSGVKVRIRDERIQQLLGETDIHKIAVALDLKLDADV
jgi:uncharacterized membrane protein